MSISFKIASLAWGIFALLAPLVPASYADEPEEVRVLSRKPDPTDPLFEIDELEGGVLFRAPKDMTFVKKDGLTSPISTEEYCARKIDGVSKQIEALRKRIAALEKKGESASDKNALSSQ